MNRPFLDKVKEGIEKYKMIADGDAVLVGVSGGIDSISLLYSLHYLKDGLNCNLIAAYANHGLRGEQSDREAEFVREIAEELKLPYVVEKIDVLRYMAEKGLSRQVAARELRYAFFERAARQYSANKIALGHNADDQAETVLMRLLRGSGASGISGMRAVRNNRIIRPLIEISRDEIISFVRESGLRYVEDSSNLKTDYLRNKIRLKLIPLLKREYNPNIMAILRETAELVGDEDEFLEGYCSTTISGAGLLKKNGAVGIDALKLKNFHIAIQRRIIRIALRMIKGDLLKISAVHTADILKLINKGISGKVLYLPDRIQAAYEYNRLRFGIQDSRFKEAGVKFDLPLKIPGETILSMMQYKFKTEIINPEDLVAAGFRLRNKHTAFFDMDKLEKKLQVRNRISGDIFHPSGMKGSKKLKEFFIDEKIPRRDRDIIPLIVSGDTILWVVGRRVADNGKVDEKTKKILRIEVKDGGAT